MATASAPKLRCRLGAAVLLAAMTAWPVAARADYWSERYGDPIGPFNGAGALVGLLLAGLAWARGWTFGERDRWAGPAVMFPIGGFLGSLLWSGGKWLLR